MEDKLSILIIEDDGTLAQMYRERLESEGFDVIWADNGEDGINAALANRPSLILLDLMMPKKGGLGVLQVLREYPDTKETPVIIMTNYPDDKYRESGERYGISDFIFKAKVMPKDIIEKIKTILSSLRNNN